MRHALVMRNHSGEFVPRLVQFCLGNRSLSRSEQTLNFTLDKLLIMTLDCRNPARFILRDAQ
jgi:hypothetical protein